MQGIWGKIMEFGGEMTKKPISSEILQRKCGQVFGGPRAETAFVKWSASRKTLRTAGLKTIILGTWWLI